LFIDLDTGYIIEVILSELSIFLSPISYLYSCKLLINGFVLSKLIRASMLSFFNRPIEGPHLVYKSESLFLKTADLVEISNSLELTVY